MKRRVSIIVIATLLIVGGVVVVKSKEKKLAGLPAPQAMVPTVQVVPLERGKLEIATHYLGSIEPFTKSDLSPRISGSILTVTKREGDNVRPGELLVTIDDRELVDRVLAVDAEVLATRQRLAGALSAYETQKSIHARDEVLFKAGAISQEALERSRAALDGAKAVVDAYKENLKGLEKNTSIARTQSGYARITAPFSGVVSRRWSEPGDLAVPGKPILTIEKRSPFKVLAQVPQEELAGIGPGSPVTLTNGGRSIAAEVTRIYPALGKNMLATVEAVIPLSPFGLPSGSTVGFDVVTRKVEGFLAPDQAVVKSSRGSFICLVKDGVVRVKPVKLLGAGNGKVALDGDLAAGELAAVAQENKLLTLAEGSRVTAVAPSTPTANSAGPGGKQ